ncbi:MAG TPA: HD domain-containing protein, partial [Solirubrobacteraceae bacterium]
MAAIEEPGSSQATQVSEQPARGDVGADPARSREQLRPAPGLSASERRLLSDLFAIVSEHAADSGVDIDRERVQDAFVFACEHHAAQLRKSGEDFIVHPVGVARICASMRLDTETLCAALLHDTVEDTSASIEEVHERFGEEISGVVDGVTKLKGITFQSRDEAQASNYRKMMVAMATDVRV